MIDLDEKQDYKNYVKHHLRNSIKLLLDRKCHSYDDNNRIACNKMIHGKSAYLSCGKNKNNVTVDTAKATRQSQNNAHKRVKSMSC